MRLNNSYFFLVLKGLLVLPVLRAAAKQVQGGEPSRYWRYHKRQLVICLGLVLAVVFALSRFFIPRAAFQPDSFWAELLVLATLSLVAFALAVSGTLLVRRWALRTGHVNIPRADRWSQRQVALLGGIGIAMAFLLTVALSPLLLGWEGPPGLFSRPDLALLLAGALIMCLLGLVDDLVHLRPSTKLIGQIACATLLISVNLRMSWTGFEVADVLLTFFWVIGITNAFNLLDNMDGLSAGTGCIASIFCALLFALYGEWQLAALSAVLAGATAGFLVFNFNPASIFMGDSGSLFIGFTLAGLTLLGAGTRQADLFAVVAVPAVLLAVPIFDTSLVTVMRKLSGRAISQGGRDHSSHRLVVLGLSERKAVLLLWALSAMGGTVAVLTNIRSLPMGRLLLPVFIISLLILGVYLARVRVYEPAGATLNGLPRRITPLLSDLMYKRHAVEVLLDLVLVILAYYGAYILRFEQSPFDANLSSFTQSLPIIVACKMLALFAFSTYRGLWRYIGLPDLVTYAKASLLGSVLSVLTVLALFRFEGYSRTLFVIDALLLFLALAASRFSFRLIDVLVRTHAKVGNTALIYGAGDGGEYVLRELLKNETYALSPIGFLDDDLTKRQRKIHGFPVLGDLAQLERVLAQHPVTTIILSSDKISRERLAALAAICYEREIELRRLQMSIESVDLVRKMQAV